MLNGPCRRSLSRRRSGREDASIGPVRDGSVLCGGEGSIMDRAARRSGNPIAATQLGHCSPVPPFGRVNGRLRTCSGSPYQSKDQRDQEHDQENDAQQLRNTRRAGSNAAKTKNGRNQRDDQEDDSPPQHDPYLLWSSFDRSRDIPRPATPRCPCPQKASLVPWRPNIERLTTSQSGCVRPRTRGRSQRQRQVRASNHRLRCRKDRADRIETGRAARQ
jgi:hypothetical protein